jgi:membrane protein implicated in regulation of membrane protease activity
MPGWLAEMSSFSVFLTIAAIGFLFLLASLFFGEVFGHFGDVHFEHGGPGFFSVRIMSVFITAFGGFGAVATESGLSTLPASGVGLASGTFFAFLIYAFARFLYGQQASTDVRTSDLVGRSARVVVAIPTGDVGQVRCRIGEELVDKSARWASSSISNEEAANSPSQSRSGPEYVSSRNNACEIMKRE